MITSFGTWIELLFLSFIRSFVYFFFAFAFAVIVSVCICGWLWSVVTVTVGGALVLRVQCSIYIWCYCNWILPHQCDDSLYHAMMSSAECWMPSTKSHFFFAHSTVQMANINMTLVRSLSLSTFCSHIIYLLTDNNRFRYNAILRRSWAFATIHYDYRYLRNLCLNHSWICDGFFPLFIIFFFCVSHYSKFNDRKMLKILRKKWSFAI